MYRDSVDLETKVDEAAARLVPLLESITKGLEEVDEAYRRVGWGARGRTGKVRNPQPACLGSGLDFISNGLGEAIGLKAKRTDFAPQLALCGSCELREPCLKRAAETREYNGIWGGLMPAERMRLWRKPRKSQRKSEQT